MTTYRGQAATPAIYDLAEGVLWDDARALVRWVDIWKGRVLAAELHGDALRVVDDIELGETVGAVALADDGGLLIAAARRLATISPEGVVSYGRDLLGDRVGVRFNDGSVDPFGSFVVGTLTIGGDTGEETLMRVDPNGDVAVLREGVRLSNGIGFSLDAGTIYHVDTLARTVSTHSYGPGSFDVHEAWQPLPLDLPDYPDGLTVDSEGTLWIAQFGGSTVRRYAPTGELLDIVTVDAEQVTCPGFVGPQLDRLAITSARENIDTVTDLAGSIFLVDVGASGLPAPRWAGSTTTPYWLRPESDER